MALMCSSNNVGKPAEINDRWSVDWAPNQHLTATVIPAKRQCLTLTVPACHHQLAKFALAVSTLLVQLQHVMLHSVTLCSVNLPALSV
jgi:hypothetical protein